ncbi:MAG: glycosyltransferase family 4 protein [Acidimicrobiia bacterium]|nr:glycosyltransferase family 4 protein [Acidimicrobiia bacterium]
MSRIFFLIPGLRPTGGVVKLFDYAGHARHLGYEPVICAGKHFRPELPLFRIERFAELTPAEGTRWVRAFGYSMVEGDRAFFSWPLQYEVAAERLPPGAAPETVIHLVQNTRHANPEWLEGSAARLLARPMARIMITREVYEACRPLLNPGSPTRLIPEGHDWGFFYQERHGGPSRPIRVAYTTWKSPLGLQVEQALADDGRFVFRSIRGTAAWPELRDLYHWCDVFLGFPNPQEGFYLVGLEAMAAGALFVTPDVEGNRAYCRWGENCLRVPFGGAPGYVGALEEIAAMDTAVVQAMRSGGYAVLQNHTLEQERRGFGEFLEELGR